MDFGKKVKILSDAMFWRNDLDDRLIEFFVEQSNVLAVRYAVGIDVGHIHQLSDDAEALIESSFDDLLWYFDKDLDGEYENIWQIFPDTFEVPSYYDVVKDREEHGGKRV